MIKFKEEKEIYEFWEKSGFFKSDPSSKKPSYSLLVPPPNLTGELHLGHAMQHSILDAVARFKRLCGFDVLLLPGVDHAGILFEATLDRELVSQNLSKEKLGREKWLERAWQFKEEVYRSVSATWRFMGLSADWGREVFTLDPGPRRAVFEQFKKYFEEGLIYKGPYIVQWCPKDNTAIEDVEMEYQEKEEELYVVRYLIDGADGSIEIATARPETIFADTGIAVYPNHPTFKKFVGKKAINPLNKRLLPIFEDKRVDKDFGTGALKITPGHDLLDYEIGKDHNLEILQVVDKSGRMTDLAGGLKGLKVNEARKQSLAKLQENDALAGTKPYKHSVAVCERCKTVMEPLISEEWFVKMDGLAKGAIRVIKEDKINFLPKNYKKILVDWLENIHDWCISRSLWWGHRIPVWYQVEGTKSQRDKETKNIKVSLESPGDGWVQDEQVLDTWFSSGLWPLSTLGWPFEFAQGKPVADAPQGKPNHAVIASTSMSLRSRAKRGRSNLSVNFAKQSKKGVAASLVKLGTRNDSEDKLMSKYFPWDFEISAPEIKYLWIARMIMISVYLTGQIPFKTMFFHGMLRDLEGRKFSKSLGNGIEPEYLIKNWGVDATRMALYTYSIPGRDGRVSRELLDERGKNFRNFAMKLRNIARFILDLKPNDSVTASTNEAVSGKIASSTKSPRNDTSHHRDDEWIKTEFEKTIRTLTNHFEKIELHLAADAIYEFVWHKFADKYIEESKQRRAHAQPVLEYVLKQSLVMLHPFMPFVTEEIYQKFDDKKKSIMLESWPSSV